MVGCNGVRGYCWADKLVGMNEKNFYTSIRGNLFKGKIKSSQFEGIDAILGEWNRRGLTDVRWLAYILATVFHETAGTMQPIEEYGKGKSRTYGYKVKYSGKPYNDTPHIYYGRGLTQNTWYENYEMLTKQAKEAGYNWDFLNHPELLLKMEPSVWATFNCMLKGKYTGKKLSDYFNDQKNDPIGARKIINGKDRAELIAGYYHKFLSSLSDFHTE